MSIEQVVNFSDAISKRKVLAYVGALKGPHRIEIKQWRPRRSNRANARYWGLIVPAAVQYMNGYGGTYTKDDVHAFFKKQFIPRPIVDPDTGEQLEVIGGDSHTLDTERFSEFMEHCSAWLADRGVVLADVEDFSCKPQPLLKGDGQ